MTGNVVEAREYRDRSFLFRDRLHAGELLADKLSELGLSKPQVLAIPSGGVPVSYAIAQKLGISLDVIIVRKLQIPWNPEAGFGALALDGTLILNNQLVSALGLSKQDIEQSISRTKEALLERERKFRDDKPKPDLRGKQVVLVDDGLASGYTMVAAIQSARKAEPERVIAAVPTASQGAVDVVAPSADTLVCLNIRGGPVFAVAEAYQLWYDLSDEEAADYLSGF